MSRAKKATKLPAGDVLAKDATPDQLLAAVAASENERWVRFAEIEGAADAFVDALGEYSKIPWQWFEDIVDGQVKESIAKALAGKRETMVTYLALMGCAEGAARGELAGADKSSMWTLRLNAVAKARRDREVDEKARALIKPFRKPLRKGVWVDQRAGGVHPLLRGA